MFEWLSLAFYMLDLLGRLLSVFKTGLYTGTQGAPSSIVPDAPRVSRIEKKGAEQTYLKHK